MNRDYLLLGVREDATKEQIKAAYQRWLAKYQAPDYADEPEYVKRKIAELTAAYDRVRAAAGTDSAGSAAASERTAAESSGQRGSRQQRVRESSSYERRRRYEQTRKTMEDEERSFADRLSGGKPDSFRELAARTQAQSALQKALTGGDLSELKHKVSDFTGRVRQSLEGGKRDDGDEERSGVSMTQVFEGRRRRRTETFAGSSEGQTLNRPASDRASGSSMGGGRAQDKSARQAGTVITVVIAVIIGLFFMIMFGAGGNDYDDYYIDGEGNGDYTYTISDYSESDRAVWEEGQQIMDQLYDMEIAGDWSEGAADETELEMAANAFVRTYTEDSSISELCDRLYTEYDSFFAESGDDISYQVDEVLQFYGFPSFYDILGNISPYSGEAITDCTQYLRYLTGYHEEHFAEAESG